MKHIKNIREDYNLITEKEQSDISKLTALVRAGLFDAKKINIIKRALEKNPAEMTLAERKILIELLESLMSEVLHSQQVYSKVKSNVSRGEMKEEVELDEAESKNYLVKMDPRFSKSMSEKDIPSIIILKRKAVRVYPDNQKVGLYYSQALDKYVSIPFETGASAHLNAGLNEAVSKNDDEQQPRKNKKLDVAQRLRKLSLKKIPSTQTGKKVSRAVTGQAFKDALSITRSRDAAERLGSLGFGLASLIPTKKKSSTSTVSAPKTIVPKVSKPLTARSPVKSNKLKNDQPTGDFKFPNKEKATDVKPKKRFNFNPKPPGTGVQPKVLSENPLAVVGAVGAAAIRAVPAAARLAKNAASKIKDKIKNRKLQPKKPGSKKPTEKPGSRKPSKKPGVNVNVDADTKSDTSPSFGSSETPTKYVDVGRFERKATTSGPKRFDTSRSIATKDASLNRKYLQQPQESVNVMEKLKEMVSNSLSEHTLNIGNDSIIINNTIAEKIVHVYKNLNEDNKIKFSDAMNESVESFKKIVNFSIRQ